MSDSIRNSDNKEGLLDRSDSRVTHANGFSGSLHAFIDRVKSGDLGSLPVVVGLVLIWGIFTAIPRGTRTGMGKGRLGRSNWWPQLRLVPTRCLLQT